MNTLNHTTNSMGEPQDCHSFLLNAVEYWFGANPQLDAFKQAMVTDMRSKLKGSLPEQLNDPTLVNVFMECARKNRKIAGKRLDHILPSYRKYAVAGLTMHDYELALYKHGLPPTIVDEHDNDLSFDEAPNGEPTSNMYRVKLTDAGWHLLPKRRPKEEQAPRNTLYDRAGRGGLEKNITAIAQQISRVREEFGLSNSGDAYAMVSALYKRMSQLYGKHKVQTKYGVAQRIQYSLMCLDADNGLDYNQKLSHNELVLEHTYGVWHDHGLTQAEAFLTVQPIDKKMPFNINNILFIPNYLANYATPMQPKCLQFKGWYYTNANMRRHLPEFATKSARQCETLLNNAEQTEDLLYATRGISDYQKQSDRAQAETLRQAFVDAIHAQRTRLQEQVPEDQSTWANNQF